MSTKNFTNKEYDQEYMKQLPPELWSMILKQRSRLMFGDRIKHLEALLHIRTLTLFGMFRYMINHEFGQDFILSDGKIAFTLWTLKLIQRPRWIEGRRCRRRFRNHAC